MHSRVGVVPSGQGESQLSVGPKKWAYLGPKR